MLDVWLYLNDCPHESVRDFFAMNGVSCTKCFGQCQAKHGPRHEVMFTCPRFCLLNSLKSLQMKCLPKVLCF